MLDLRVFEAKIGHLCPFVNLSLGLNIVVALF